MFVRIWRFEVKPEHASEFESMNGADGDWVRLFSRAPGFLETRLEAIPGKAGVYRTRDFWRSAGDFRAFLAAHADDYRALDAHAEPWTTDERLEFEGLYAGEHSGHDEDTSGPAAGRPEDAT